MRSVVKYSIAIVAALAAASPVVAAGGYFAADVMLEPQFWVVAVSVLGMIGLAAGNGLGNRKTVGARPYADHLHTSSPNTASTGANVLANEDVPLAEAA